MTPRVSIVIVNYNGRHLLEPCLTSTMEQARAYGADVVLVDNASTDGSVEYAQSAFPDVAIVRNARNAGFAAGCNTGVRAARGDWIVLLNNDAVPEPNWLASLVETAKPKDVAVASSVVREERYPEAYALGTGSISVIGHPIPGAGRDAEHPFYATGCALIFKREVFDEPFDGDFFAYYEDTLLSWRAHLLGYRVARSLQSSVQHVGSATAWRDPELAAYFYERNKVLLLILTYEPGTLLRLIPLYCFDGAVRLGELWRGTLHRGTLPARQFSFARHYLLLARALGWIVLHPLRVAHKRARIQRERSIPDSEITCLLSGKIFDDLVSSRFHSWANRVALAYCRVAGIRTVDL